VQRVNVPYEIQDKKLIVQNLSWPGRCPCCGTEENLTRYGLHHLAEKVESRTEISVTRSGFPLSWSVPYCPVCLRHAALHSRLLPIIFIVAGALWVLLGYLLYLGGLAENVIAIGLFVAALGVIGYAAYVIYHFLRDNLVRSRMTPRCRHHGYAVEVTSQRPYITFTFHDDEYAATFFAVNDGAVAPSVTGVG
jgi:hypothetical protein